MTAEAAFTVAMVAGYLALVVALAWADPHCKDCPQRHRKGEKK
jgi:hypothetical protein